MSDPSSVRRAPDAAAHTTEDGRGFLQRRIAFFGTQLRLGGMRGFVGPRMVVRLLD